MVCIIDHVFFVADASTIGVYMQQYSRASPFSGAHRQRGMIYIFLWSHASCCCRYDVFHSNTPRSPKNEPITGRRSGFTQHLLHKFGIDQSSWTDRSDTRGFAVTRCTRALIVVPHSDCAFRPTRSKRTHSPTAKQFDLEHKPQQTITCNNLWCPQLPRALSKSFTARAVG